MWVRAQNRFLAKVAVFFSTGAYTQGTRR